MTSYLHIFLNGLHKPKKDLIHYIICVQPKILIQVGNVNPLNAELNPICHLLALLGAHHILHVGGVKVNT